MAGVQIKAPMHLDAKGVLSPASGKPFTHILKPAGGGGGYEHLPTIEWVGMALGRVAGFVVPDCALVAMPDRMPPALVVERFDIRQGGRDDRLIALEDFCSVLGLPIEAKYDSTMERVARALRPLSTAPEGDLRILLRRALFAWLIADGDMHLKNLSLIKIAHPGDRQFRTVRVAPLYDCVTTRVFPKLKNDRMALKLNGKDDNLRRSDFRAFAGRIGLKASEAEADMDGLVERLCDAEDKVSVPRVVRAQAEASKLIEKMFSIIRIQRFGA
jgi:serine/threonine-protein kinase HipA